MEKPIYTCETCRYSGPVFSQNDVDCVECRKAMPNSSFPIMNKDSWCWSGMMSEHYIAELIEISKKRA
jgi:hypothetical protein